MYPYSKICKDPAKAISGTIRDLYQTTDYYRMNGRFDS